MKKRYVTPYIEVIPLDVGDVMYTTSIALGGGKKHD